MGGVQASATDVRQSVSDLGIYILNLRSMLDLYTISGGYLRT